MADRPRTGNPPSSFLGNFNGYIQQVRNELEASNTIDDPGSFASLDERLDAEAQFVAAQDWLVERWGAHYPCPVCQNVEWVVSEIGQAVRPAGFLSFTVTCAYCANTMQVVPGRAYLAEPVHPHQLQFPASE